MMAFRGFVLFCFGFFVSYPFFFLGGGGGGGGGGVEFFFCLLLRYNFYGKQISKFVSGGVFFVNS